MIRNKKTKHRGSSERIPRKTKKQAKKEGDAFIFLDAETYNGLRYYNDMMNRNFGTKITIQERFEYVMTESLKKEKDTEVE